MALTVDQICDQQFSEADGNYVRGEVDNFLDKVCDTLDELNEQIASLQEQLAQANAKAAAAEERAARAEANASSSGTDMATQSEVISLLGNAQRVVREMQEESKQRAESIVAEAQKKADTMLSTTQKMKEALSNEVENLRTESTSLRKDLLDTLAKYRDMIENQ